MNPLRPEVGDGPAPAARGAFVWPPARPEISEITTAPPPAPAAEPPAPAPAKWVSWWRDFERIWLAPATPPLGVLIEQTGWSPDPAAAYCERCGVTLGHSEIAAGDFGCASCRARTMVWERMVRLGEFRDPLASWVARVKFARCHWLGESLGRELGHAVARSGVVGGSGRFIVVPVPMSWRHRVTSGIDHAAAIARGAASALGCHMRPLLSREHRPTQRGLSPTAREANVKGTMWLRRPIPPGVTVLLVDDVCTTGATLRAAARALRAGDRTKGGRKSHAEPPIRVIACVLAKTPDPSRRATGPNSPEDRGFEAKPDVDEVGNRPDCG